MFLALSIAFQPSGCLGQSAGTATTALPSGMQHQALANAALFNPTSSTPMLALKEGDSQALGTTPANSAGLSFWSAFPCLQSKQGHVCFH